MTKTFDKSLKSTTKAKQFSSIQKTLIVSWNRIGQMDICHTKKEWIMVFVLIFLLVTSEGKNLTSDFPVFPSYQGRKQGTEERFSRLRQRRSLEMFPRFPFLYRGQFFPKTCQGKKLEQNAFFSFHTIFVKFSTESFL